MPSIALEWTYSGNDGQLVIFASPPLSRGAEHPPLEALVYLHQENLNNSPVELKDVYEAKFGPITADVPGGRIWFALYTSDADSSGISSGFLSPPLILSADILDS